jgi:anti-sigma regulatory factor (Ser/Thr protein kinase)
MQLRAIQLQHPTLVASHRSAAALHGIELNTYAVEVTDSASCLSRLLGYTIRRLPLVEADIVTIDGIRVTAALRTLTDLQRALPRDEAVMATDCALHRRLVDRQQLIAALHATASRRSTAAALGCLALADPRCESLLVSELVTNAYRHADGNAFVSMDYAPKELCVSVWDASPGLPVVAAEPDGEAGRGRGLPLVSALANEWGVARIHDEAAGVSRKGVWFRLRPGAA